MSHTKTILDPETKHARRQEALKRNAAKHQTKLRASAKERMHRIRAQAQTQTQKDNKLGSAAKYREKNRESIRAADALRRARKCIETDGVEAYDERIQRSSMARTQKKYERRPPSPRPKPSVAPSAKRYALEISGLSESESESESASDSEESDSGLLNDSTIPGSFFYGTGAPRPPSSMPFLEQVRKELKEAEEAFTTFQLNEQAEVKRQLEVLATEDAKKRAEEGVASGLKMVHEQVVTVADGTEGNPAAEQGAKVVEEKNKDRTEQPAEKKRKRVPSIKEKEERGEDLVVQKLSEIDNQTSSDEEGQLKRLRTGSDSQTNCNVLETKIQHLEQILIELGSQAANEKLSEEVVKGVHQRKLEVSRELVIACDALKEARKSAQILKEKSGPGKHAPKKGDKDLDANRVPKKDIEEWWRISFTPEAETYAAYYQKHGGPEGWREAEEAAAETAVNKFLIDPENNTIPQKDQFKCRFHIEKRSQKQAKQVDGPALGKFPMGLWHAGCEITSVLWDFFWWKTWTVASGNPKITDLEMMKSDVLDVRHRAFFIQAYKKATKLDLDDLYTGTDIQFGSDPYVQRVALTQANRLVRMAGQSGKLDFAVPTATDLLIQANTLVGMANQVGNTNFTVLNTMNPLAQAQQLVQIASQQGHGDFTILDTMDPLSQAQQLVAIANRQGNRYFHYP
ncbi:hypothetical protein B0H14DRAFT_3513558 [Mycena olivaceomarginata]|nr:hypothetical protein B0H14DRAFT_3513558 [Mycena olivaceomarginata]